jgi:hypothetical protein
MQDSHFLRKWSGQTFLREDSFSLGCTLFSTEEWPKVCNGPVLSIRDRHSLG